MPIILPWVRNLAKNPVKLPHAILSCMPLDAAMRWKRKNAWADNIPWSHFGGSEMAPLGDVFNDWPSTGIPSRCENPPPMARTAFATLRSEAREEMTHSHRAWHLYREAVHAVALDVAAQNAPVWIIGADADQGLMAVEAAYARGGFVAAIAGAPIGLIGASVCATRDVSVSVIDFTTELVQ